MCSVLPIRLPPPYEDISFEIVTNDGTDVASEKLTTLKNIFSRQLPKMPKEYIVRLVFDHRHFSLAIVKHQVIIGGICYRPYFEQRFGEIAFCAIHSTEQVRGYGTVLMNQLKAYVIHEKLEYFLTYADNYAIGYFQKQGFSKHISMPKERWVGFIKDYDGGTLMECYIHPAVQYGNVQEMVKKQRQFILDRIASQSSASTVYEGMHVFEEGKKLNNVLEVPGVVEAGWTGYGIYRAGGDRDRTAAQGRLNGLLKPLLERVRQNKYCRLFIMNTPSESSQVISFAYIQDLFKQGDYYRSKEALGADLLRMIEAGKTYIQLTAETSEAMTGLSLLVKELFFDNKESVVVTNPVLSTTFASTSSAMIVEG